MYEKEGFVLNLNGITRGEYVKFMTARESADNAQAFDVEQFYFKVLVKWPFEAPLSVEGFYSLGLADSIKVDNVVTDAILEMNKKK